MSSHRSRGKLKQGLQQKPETDFVERMNIPRAKIIMFDGNRKSIRFLWELFAVL